MWHVVLTSAIDRYRADSGVAGSNRYNIPDDPRVAEKEQWFLFRNWRRWPGTWDVLLARAGFRLVRMMIPLPVCERRGTLGNGWEHWSVRDSHKILARLS